MSSIVDTPESMTTLLNSLTNLPTSPPSLYLDLEGIYLSRHGSISILELFVLPQNHVYLIDIHVLGALAFSTPSSSSGGHTLKSILESATIPKVFFDVRNDSDALFSHFGIHLAGIQDLQLIELATRRANKKFLAGLAKCIANDAPMTGTEKAAWKAVKDEGVMLFDPQRGGSYDVFNVRPMTELIKKYCVQDVKYLPGLLATYAPRLSKAWAEKVRVATLARVAASQEPGFNGKGKHMALGPWGS